MKVCDSVRKSIDDWSQGEFEASMLHACNAIDGTAKKVYPTLSNKLRFTRLLRENYLILGSMGTPGINIVETRFPVSVKNPTTPDGKPDLADVIYGVHRCTHGHGDELPIGFDLIQDAAGPPRNTRIGIKGGAVQLSDRIIFGLIAIAVLSSANLGQRVPDGYFLTFSGSEKLFINDWWGRKDDFAIILSREPLPSVVLNLDSMPC